jgi:hypothetical protein
MPPEAARGSHKLLSDLIKKGSAATPEEVKAAVSIPANSDIKLLRWLVRGTPVYWEIETIFQLQPRQLGDVVNHFVATAGIRDINILINGTPKPDLAQIGAVIAHGDIKEIG